jgi:AraC family transcriptional regulator
MQRAFVVFFQYAVRLAMTSHDSARVQIRRVLGQPEISCRIPCESPFVLERYRALLDVTDFPPFSEPLLFVHTGGKPMSYRTRSAASAGLSMPGLVTLIPAGASGQLALRGVGEGVVAYFDGKRGIPEWVSRRREREPTTFVDNLVVTLTRQLASAASEARPDDAYLAVLGNALLAQLRHAISGIEARDTMRGSRSALVLVHLAVQHIQQHCDGVLSIADLASTVGVGVTHFSNTFRQVTGVTPHRYVLRARLERACELLRMTSLSIGEIAAAVGFAGQSHFCTAFSREMGVTPSRYRRSCRESRPPAQGPGLSAGGRSSAGTTRPRGARPYGGS